MDNNILVLGATGNIGSVLTQLLKRSNARFAGAVPASELAKLGSRGMTGIEVDFDDTESLRRAMEGRDRLFMLLPLHEKMLEWSDNILNAARRAGVTFIVRSSLMDAHFDSPYSTFKVHGQIDRLVRESGIPYAIVHPNHFMQNFIVYEKDEIMKDGTMYSPHDGAKVSYADVRDIAQADAAILLAPESHRGKEYDITGPQALTDEEVATQISQASGRQVKVVHVTLEQYEESMREHRIDPWTMVSVSSLEKHIADGKAAAVAGDYKALTGREPHTFEQFARDHADAWAQIPVTA